jgi:hypothetical protein
MRAICTFFLVALASANSSPVRAEPVKLPDGRTLQTVDFDRHIHALLDRQGCNAGKCHGNRQGRGGFTLSLFAASADADYLELARQGRGRHLNVVHPDQSLLLLKATGAVPHDGGIRIVPGSWEHQVVREWIAGGARREAGRGRLQNLRVVPHEHIFQPLDSLQLKVIAEFADGTEEDVTCFSDFRNPDVEIVDLNPAGRIHAIRPGDVGIQVFYRGRARVVRARVAVPLKKGTTYPSIPEVNLIDRAVFADLRRLNIVPSGGCSDEHFLRRVTLDLLGSLPSPEEVRAFLASKDPERRTKKIDELLAHPLHAASLAVRLCELTDLVDDIGENARAPQVIAAQMAHGWFRKRLQENVPYDRIVRDVLTATSEDAADLKIADTGFGTEYPLRPTLDHYWRFGGIVREVDPVFGQWARESRPVRRPVEVVDATYLEDVAERTAGAFLGVRLECARCHNHPLEGWTPEDHRAFANLFGRVGLEKVPFKGNRQQWAKAALSRRVFVASDPIQLPRLETVERTFLLAATSRSHAGASGGILKPRMLAGPEADLGSDPRQALVDWLTHPSNPFFARHFVNWMWEHYFGVALVESTDGYASAFPSAHKTLLDELAQEFIRSGFDIRRLERTMLMSSTYQLSGAPTESNRHDRTNFARVLPRRLSARTAGEIVHTALEMKENFGPGVPAGLHAVEVIHLGETSAVHRPTADYKEQIARMVHRFGRAELVSRCDNETDLGAYLHLYGSSQILNLLEKSKRAQRLAKSEQTLDEKLDECFLATLSRFPTPAERKNLSEFARRERANSRQEAFADILWALINSKEFSFRQ